MILPPVKGIDPKTGEEIRKKAADDEPFSALAFKIATDPYVGTLTFFRVYSGTLKAGSYVLNSVNRRKGKNRKNFKNARQSKRRSKRNLCRRNCAPQSV